MAAIVFPIPGTPYTVTPFTDANGKQWLYSGTSKNRWSPVAESAESPGGLAAAYTASDTPPAEHTLPWYDTSDGTWSVWNTDRSVWVSTDVSGVMIPHLMRRFDIVGAVSYYGSAPLGTADSAETWNVTRVTTATDGSVVVDIAHSVRWNDRLTATYA